MSVQQIVPSAKVVSSNALKNKFEEEKVKFKEQLYNSQTDIKQYNPKAQLLHTSYFDYVIEHLDHLYDLIEQLLLRQQQLELRVLPVQVADLSCLFVVRNRAYAELSAQFTLGKAQKEVLNGGGA